MALEQPGSLLVSVSPGAIKGMLMPGVWTMLVPKGYIASGAMMIWVSCIATWVPGDIGSWAAAEEHVWVYGPTITRFCVDVHGPW